MKDIKSLIEQGEWEKALIEIEKSNEHTPEILHLENIAKKMLAEQYIYIINENINNNNLVRAKKYIVLYKTRFNVDERIVLWETELKFRKTKKRLEYLKKVKRYLVMCIGILLVGALIVWIITPHDYTKDIQKLRENLSMEGDSLLTFSIEKHFGLYQKKKSGLYLYNFDTKEEKCFFSDTTKLKFVSYISTLTEVTKTKKETNENSLKGYISDCRLLEEHNSCIFKHTNSYSYEEYYLYSFDNPKEIIEIFVNDGKPIFKNNLIKCEVYVSGWPYNDWMEKYLSNDTKYMILRDGLRFSKFVWINKNGIIILEDDEFHCDYYNIITDIHIFEDQFKMKSFCEKINEAVTLEKRQYYLNFYKERITSVDFLKRLGENDLLQVKGEYMLIKGVVQHVEKGEEKKGYKYNINIYSEIRCYTNDGNTQNISVGDSVYILGKLTNIERSWLILLYKDFEKCLVFKNLDELIDYSLTNPHSTYTNNIVYYTSK